MGATPRPWVIAGAGPEIAMETRCALYWIGPPNSRRLAATCDSVHEDNLANADLIVRAVNAFAALLAVAKAADKVDESYQVEGELAKLDAAAPGWREWTA